MTGIRGRTGVRKRSAPRVPARLVAGVVLGALWATLATGAVGGQAIRTPDEARAAADEGPPVPVALVPGWGDGAPQLAALQARLVEAGWPPGRVATVDFADPFGSNREHAGEIGREVEALRAGTGEERVDVVAHSMGGLALRRHLLESGGESVRRVVFLATPHRGTVAAHLAWGRGSEEMEPGSPFLDSLNAAPAVPVGVEALNVRTPLDLRVVPRANATVPSADGRVRDVEVCCPTHPGMLDDPRIVRIVVEFLRNGEVAPVSGEALREGAR